MLRIVDGHDTIGGTKIVVSSHGTTLALDWGMSFSKHSQVFGMTLQPRSHCGIADLINCGIVKRIGGIFRPDLMPKGFELNPEFTIDLDAIVLSHGHADHVGEVPLLRHDIPIVASAATAVFMRVSQDLGPGGFMNELAFAIPRSQHKAGESRLRTPSRAESPAISRPLLCLDGETGLDLRHVWGSPLTSKSREIVDVICVPSPSTIGAVTVRAVEIDHSLVGSRAIILPDIGLCYTGDIRFGGRAAAASIALVEELEKGNPDILICEGTRIGRRDDLWVTETDVFEHCLKVVSRAKGLVVADFPTRHMERLDSFRRIAALTNRRFTVSTKDLLLLTALQSAASEDRPSLDGIFVLVKEGEPKTWESDLLDKHRHRLISVRDITRAPSEFILAMSLGDAPHLLDIPTQGGVWIYAGSTAHSSDQIQGAYRLANWVEALGMTLHGFTWDGIGINGKPAFDPRYNASGHATCEQIERLVMAARPKYLLPIHTEVPAWFETVAKRAGAKLVTAASHPAWVVFDT